MLGASLLQVGQALAYYLALVAVLQGAALESGTWNAVVFVLTVFFAHRALTWGCRRWPRLRILVRGRSRALVRDGIVIEAALELEGVSRDELLAGLRRLGYDTPEKVRLAVLEETGHISALERNERQADASR